MKHDIATIHINKIIQMDIGEHNPQNIYKLHAISNHAFIYFLCLTLCPVIYSYHTIMKNKSKKNAWIEINHLV